MAGPGSNPGGTPGKPQQLSADYVRKVAKLLCQAVSDGEVAELQVKLSAVVGYVERLRGLDLDGVEPMANVSDSTNRLDEDVPGPTLATETLMEMSPAVMPPFIKVPKVLDAGGES